MKIQHHLILIFTLFLMASCGSTSQFVIQKKNNATNIPSIGIELILDSALNKESKEDIKNSFFNVLKKMKLQKSTIPLHAKTAADTNYITVVIDRIVTATKGAKVAGYALLPVTTILLPRALINANSNVIVSGYIVPKHGIKSLIVISKNLAVENYDFEEKVISTHALFSSNNVQIPAMYKKFEDYLTFTINDINRQLLKHTKRIKK